MQRLPPTSRSRQHPSASAIPPQQWIYRGKLKTAQTPGGTTASPNLKSTAHPKSLESGDVSNVAAPPQNLRPNQLIGRIVHQIRRTPRPITLRIGDSKSPLQHRRTPRANSA